MAGTTPPEPGERPTAQGRAARELAQPPSLRYRPTPAGDARKRNPFLAFIYKGA